MDVRYHIDPDTGLPHLYGHGVTEAEAEYVLRHSGEDRAGRDGSRHALGADRRRPISPCQLCPR